MSLAYGLGGFVSVPAGPVSGNGAPSSSFKGQLGQQYFDVSTSPPTEYIYNGLTWQAGGNAEATTTTPGIVTLFDTDTFVGADDTTVPTSLTVKTYVDATAIAGAPVSTETTAGIGQLATNAEAVAGTPSTGALALFVTPSNLASVFAAPPAMGGTTPAAGTFTDLTADGTLDLDSTVAAHMTVTGAADLTLNSTAGSVVIAGGEAVADAVSIQAAAGGLDVDTALLLSLRSSRNNASAIEMVATAGGIDITATGTAGEDVDITATGSSVNITATEDAADSIVISSTNGGIDITAAGAAAGEDIDITATGSSINLTSTENAALSIYLHANGGASETIRLRADQGTGVDSIDLLSDVGGVTITGGVASADAVNIVASDAAGGIDMDAGTAGIAADTSGAIVATSTKNAAASIYLRANGGTSETVKIHADQGTGVASLDLLSDVGGITLTAGVASADAINIVASNAAGGIDVDAGTNGVIVDTTGAISLDSAAASNFTVTGAFDLSLISSLGSVNVTAGEDAADAIVLSAGAGGIDILATGAAGQDIDVVNTGGSVNISATESAADSITIVSTAGGIDILASGAAAGEDIDIVATGSSVNITSTEDVSDAIYIRANAGTSEAIKIHADQGTGVASVNVLSDVGGITLRATGLASADAINLEAAAGGVDVDAALQINIASSQDAADAVRILASAGGIDVDAVGAAGQDIVITNTGGSVSLVATEAAADAIVFSASNAAGGIDLSTGGGSIDLSSAGSVTMVAGTDSQAGSTCTVNKNVFAATYTGFTTASAASQVFTITNSVVTTSSQVILTLCNEGANDAQMTIQRVKRLAGSLEVTAKNNGAAALNGNVTITGWVIG